MSSSGGQKKKAPQDQGKQNKGKQQEAKKNQPQQPKQQQPAKKSQPKQTKPNPNPNQKKPNPNQKQGQKKEQKKVHRAKVSEKASGQKKGNTKGSNATVQRLAKERLQVIIRSKYQNPTTAAKPTSLESRICEYLVDLEASDKELKTSLRDLGIVAAREQAITSTKKAIIIFVPYRQLSRWQRIQTRVGVELEKKFSGQDVLFLAQRKVMKLHDIKNNYLRPRNQTITSVHESILNDLVYPTKIVGKRLRFRVGGKRILKVFLDPKNSKEIEPKLQTYEVVYKKLTKKITNFVFPRYVI